MIRPRSYINFNATKAVAEPADITTTSKSANSRKMGITVQDSETGEVDYIHCDNVRYEAQEYDAETGEPANGKWTVRYNKSIRFQIPKEFLKGSACEQFEKALTSDYNSKQFEIKAIPIEEDKPKVKKQQYYESKDFMNMEGVNNEIIMGYNKSTYLLFFIPSLFIFNIWIYAILSLLEMFLHIWAHCKNNLNMNKRIYFRSPLHVLSSQFCAACRSESEMEWRIFATLNKQMRGARKSQALKDVTKAFG